MARPVTAPGRPTLAAIALYFLRLGALRFGGPVALAEAIRVDLAEKRGWLSPEEYDEGLAIATACPGPLAYKLGVYCGYVLQGGAGALTAAIAFAFAPFVIVIAIGYAYLRFAGAWELRALFYGVGPVVVAIIVKACWSLGQSTMRADRLAWLVAALTCAITIVFQRELMIVFLAAGVLGIFTFARAAQTTRAPGQPRAGDAEPDRATTFKSRAVAPLFGLIAAAKGVTALQLFAFFFRTGLLVFGSGLVIVPFLKTYVVDQYHWLDQRQFVDAVAIGLMTPGPVVITATFVGFVLQGLGGAAAATAGIFAPSLLFIALGTPLLRRYRDNVRLRGFIRGITVAVVGALVGTSYLVARATIGDVPTALFCVAALAATIWVKRMPDPVLVLGGALFGLVVYPMMHPG